MSGDELIPTTARTLRDWLTDPTLLHVPAMVIPHLAVAGRVSLFSGREKIGKSTLAASVVAAASRGESVLGVPLAGPVRVLWYSIDEPYQDTVRRFQNLGADQDNVIINTVPRKWGELLTALQNDTQAYGADLIVVDTLSRVFSASGIDANSAKETEPVMGTLVDFFHGWNVSALLLYHTGKAGREYRGSTGIGATVDEIITLRKRGHASDEDDFDDEPGDDDGRRLLVQDGRNLRGRVQLTCVGGIYRLYEETHSPRAKILEALGDLGPAKSRTELVARVGGRKQNALRAITELVAEGSIVESGHRIAIAAAGMRELTREPAREPTGERQGFPGSQRFPQGGTAPEPTREPETLSLPLAGSQIGIPPIQKREPGADLAVPGSDAERELLAKLERTAA